MQQNRFFWVPLTCGLIVLVLSLAVAIWKMSSERLDTSRPTNQAEQEFGSMSLSPASGEFAFTKEKTYTVSVAVDSSGKTIDGVDVVVNFDPKRVQVVGSAVLPTSLFEKFPLNTVDNTTGQIRFSALTFDPKPVSGVAATFSFKPIVPGEASFTIDFKQGATTDSNIAEHATAKDILGTVQNVKYTFR